MKTRNLILAAIVMASSHAACTSHAGVCTETNRPVPATYIMVCCHGADKGTKFLANGEWDARHDYRDFGFALEQMRKIKEAGINVVGVDFTNQSQWDQFKAHHWPMLQNVVRAAKELDMQYFLFLGNTCAHTMKYWNEKAKIVWEEFAQDQRFPRLLQRREGRDCKETCGMCLSRPAPLIFISRLRLRRLFCYT